jgi:hypothetical protein
VSHCHLFFHLAAMEACLAADEPEDALHFAAGLAAYTANEPLPFADFFVRRAKVLTGQAPAEERTELIELAQQAGLNAALALLER